MILQERQEYLNTVFHNIEGINRRRTYISTQYAIAHERFDRTLSEADRDAIEKYQVELENIEDQVSPLFKKLRDIQTRYLVEFDGESIDNITNRTSMHRYTEELYFLTNCEIDTFIYEWDIEEEDAQELLYEIADFLLQHRFTKFFIRNIKRL
jgi:predicted  nucleic acid-binding Zn-ribbon protein